MTESVNRQFILASRPAALPTPEEVPMVESPMPQAGEGEVVVRNIYLAMDPAIRGWMSDEPNYIEPIPVGAPVRAGAIGRVVQSNSPTVEVGSVVTGMLGWEDYSCVPAEQVNAFDPMGAPLTMFLNVLGSSGLTAYFGLLDVGQPKAGDTLLVSGAAGSVGSLVGQIGKIKGCRVIGIAGGEEKCRWVKDDLGFDEVIDYKADGDLQDAIAAACPDGVDIYFDNVGGDMLDAVLMNLAQSARVVICGWISTYNDAEKRPGPKNLWQLLAKSARMEGFVVMSYMDRAEEGVMAMVEWLQEGKLQFKEHVEEGLENALDTFHMLFDGRNNGRLILKVSDEEE